MKTKQELFNILQSLSIKYITYNHKPVYTVQESNEACSTIPGHHVKNLFLKDKKNKLWLVVMPDSKTINLKELAKNLAAPRFSFASKELLYQYLGVEPGSVTPLGIINDIEQKVSVVIDKELLDNNQVNIHPLRNDMTIGMSSSDLEKFLQHCKNIVIKAYL